MFRMDLFMANLVNYPHVLRVISRRVALIENDVMALEALTIGQRITAHRATVSLLPGESVIFRLQAFLPCPLLAPLPVQRKARVVW